MILDIRKKIFYKKASKTLAQVVQREDRCPIPGSIHGDVEWDSEQPDLVEVSLLIAERLD